MDQNQVPTPIPGQQVLPPTAPTPTPAPAPAPVQPATPVAPAAPTPHLVPNLNAAFNPTKIVPRDGTSTGKNPKMIVIGAIVLAVIALGVGGYFLYSSLFATGTDETASTETPVVSEETSPALATEAASETPTAETPTSATETTTTTASTPVTPAADELTLTSGSTTSTTTTDTTKVRRRRAN